MKIHSVVTRVRQLSSPDVVRVFCGIGFAVVVFAFSNQSWAQPESNQAAISEIVDSRMREAVQSNWSDATGFSIAPMKLEETVKERDSARIKELEETYSTIWKSVGPAFAAAYARRQQPINDKHVQKSEELRSLICKAIETAVNARGGGSTSGSLHGFAGAETEWVLRQLWNGSAHPISDESFAKQLRSSIFYVDGSPHSPEYAKEFSESLELLRKALRLLTPEQQSVLREEVLMYFSD